MNIGEIVRTSIRNVVVPAFIIYSATSCAIGEWNPSEWMGTVITDS